MTDELEFDTPSGAEESLNILCFLDVETTGLPNFKLPADDPSQPRVCSFAALETDATGKVINGFASLVKPDNWPPIDEKAFDAHGLTVEHCERFGLPVEVVMSVAAQMLGRADRRVGHNLPFDLKLIRGELRRAQLPDHYDKSRDYCTMRSARDICRIPPTDRMMGSGRKGFKSPSLAEAYQHFFGQPFKGAHTALGDVNACRAVYFAINPPQTKETAA